MKLLSTSGRRAAVTNHLSFLVGRDRAGYWLAVERHGLGGGIFTSRKAALAYARAECCGAPGSVQVVRRPLEFMSFD
jgi:hypothetical protein